MVQALKDRLLNLIVFGKLNDEIGGKVLQLRNIDIGFNSTINIITFLSGRMDE